MRSDVGEVVVTCGSCGSKLHVRPGAAARMEKCSTCGTRLQIEAAATVVAKPTGAGSRAREGITIDEPPQGTFLFFPAAAAGPEIRAVPTNRQKGRRDFLRSDMGAIAIGAFTVVALCIGIAAGVAIVRLGGTELWVVKRSAVAWIVGMIAAGAMLVASPRRDTSIRLLAATTAAASVVLARQIAGPAVFGPVDLLLVALALAGSACGFILAEKPGEKRAC